MALNRIDVHQHLIPPFWAAALPKHGGDPSGWKSPQWSPEDAVSFMDSQEIATSIVSLTAPGIEGWVSEERADVARRVNDYGADLTRQLPDRFGCFATLALPDVDAALAEIARAFDELGADGVILHSNFDGIYLGHPSLKPVWKELDRRAAVVYIHPTTPKVSVLPGVPGPIEDYPADTTRAAVDLIASGYMTRYKSMKVILSHAGGFLPYAAARFAELLHAAVAPERSVSDLLSEMKEFYFDTALAAPTRLPSLLAFAVPGHVLFGTDYPYAPVSVVKSFTESLDAYDNFDRDQLADINGAGRALFPRLLGFGA